MVDAPAMRKCSKSGRVVLTSCLAKCEISGAEVLCHLLVTSDTSGRPPRNSAPIAVSAGNATCSSLNSCLIANPFTGRDCTIRPLLAVGRQSGSKPAFRQLAAPGRPKTEFCTYGR
jgi:hypothetical protein